VELGHNDQVSALMTAESIIVGFLPTYAALIHERVVYLKDQHLPVFPTALPSCPHTEGSSDEYVAFADGEVS
jgi:hypothetical protein